MVLQHKPNAQLGFSQILIVIVVLSLAIILAVYLIQQRTNVVPHASVERRSTETVFELVPDSRIVTKGQQFNLTIKVKNTLEAANLFSLVLKYPKDQVEVLSIEPKNRSDREDQKSFVKFWVKRSDDKAGTVKLIGAVPNPGFPVTKGESVTMATVQFRVIESRGDIVLNVGEESAIYSNSTNKNILSSLGSLTLKTGPVVSATRSPGLETPRPIVNPGSMQLTPAIATVGRGCHLQVAIDINTGQKISDGTDVILFFDPKQIIVNKTTNGSIYKINIPRVDNQKGRMTFSGITLTGFRGEGTLASIDLLVSKDVSVGQKINVSFDFDPDRPNKTIDSNIIERGTIKDLLGKVTDGVFTVGGTSCQ